MTAFDCGDEDLNDFILTDAPLYFRVRLATSYVLEEALPVRCLAISASPTTAYP